MLLLDLCFQIHIPTVLSYPKLHQIIHLSFWLQNDVHVILILIMIFNLKFLIAGNYNQTILLASTIPMAIMLVVILLVFILALFICIRRAGVGVKYVK